MKKLILTISAAAGISIGAFGQGALFMQSQSTAGGVSSASQLTSTSDWFTGNITLELFSIADTGTSEGYIAAINGMYNNPFGAAAALTADGFTQQAFGTTSGNETLSQSVSVTGGSFNIGPQVVGTSDSLTTGNNVIYAIYGFTGDNLAGVLVFSPSTTGAPSPGQPVNFNTVWPNQNLYLAPVPEPATIALAGLSGLSLLLFRRRKA